MKCNKQRCWDLSRRNHKKKTDMSADVDQIRVITAHFFRRSEVHFKWQWPELFPVKITVCYDVAMIPWTCVVLRPQDGKHDSCGDKTCCSSAGRIGRKEPRTRSTEADLEFLWLWQESAIKIRYKVGRMAIRAVTEVAQNVYKMEGYLWGRNPCPLFLSPSLSLSLSLILSG
jgi:hypothetical protein